MKGEKQIYAVIDTNKTVIEETQNYPLPISFSPAG